MNSVKANVVRLLVEAAREDQFTDHEVLIDLPSKTVIALYANGERVLVTIEKP